MKTNKQTSISLTCCHQSRENRERHHWKRH